MIIDCDTCEVRDRACSDCVVPVLLGHPVSGGGALDLDAGQARALGVLARSGLVPPLRLVPRTYSGPRAEELSAGAG